MPANGEFTPVSIFCPALTKRINENGDKKKTDRCCKKIKVNDGVKSEHAGKTQGMCSQKPPGRLN